MADLYVGDVLVQGLLHKGHTPGVVVVVKIVAVMVVVIAVVVSLVAIHNSTDTDLLYTGSQ